MSNTPNKMSKDTETVKFKGVYHLPVIREEALAAMAQRYVQAIKNLEQPVAPEAGNLTKTLLPYLLIPMFASLGSLLGALIALAGQR